MHNMTNKILFLGLHNSAKSGVVRVQKELTKALQKRNYFVDNLAIPSDSSVLKSGHELNTNQGEIIKLNNIEDFFKKIEQQKPYDIIHSHSWAWAPLMKKEYSIDKIIDQITKKHEAPKIIHTIHSFIEEEYPYHKSLIGLADITTILSSAKEEELKQKTYGEKTNYTVIPNMVLNTKPSNKLVRELKQKINPENEKILLYVGRLEKEKGIYEFSNAISEIYKTNKDFKVLIVGASSNGNQCEEKMKKILTKPIQDNKIIFTGWVPEKEISLYQQISDLQITPSYTEAFNLSIPQGILNDCTQAISNIPTLQEIYNLDSNLPLALSFLPKNTNSLIKTIKTFLHDPAQYDALKKRAKLEINNNYSEEKIVQQYINIYNQILNSKK